MRRLPAAVLVIACLTLHQGLAFASYKKATDKYERGLLNMVLCWFEAPYQVHEEMEKNPWAGIPIGVGKAFYMMPLRFGTGAVDVFTCPFPFPVKDYGPIIEPEINPWVD